MKKRSLFIFCLILISVGGVASQTVTNADLEKYRQERLKAERDYRDNYERLGLPSPEELDRRREESLKQTEELSAKLRAERLERERIEAYREAESRAAAYERQLAGQGAAIVYTEPGFLTYGGYGGYGRGWIRGRHRRGIRFNVQPGYFAGGQFWRTGTVRPRSAPMLIQKRGSRR